MKEFVSHDTIRDSALKLVYKIYKEDHFIPDIIYSSMRGGAYLGNVFSEFYKIVCAKENHKPVMNAAVVARSREALIPGEDTKVIVDGWTFPPEELKTGSKVLIVDDIYDTGNTVNLLANVFLDAGIKREDLKIAVFDYKVPLYKDKKPLPIQPDYYCRKHVLNSPDDETWIHYMSHELIGLKPEEIDSEYSDPEVRSILHEIV